MATIFDKVNDIADNSDFTGVLNKSKSLSIETIRVATLAFFYSVKQAYTAEKKYGIINVKPFPLVEQQVEYIIEAYYFKDLTFSDNEIVTCVFTDYNFIPNLNKSNPITVNDPRRHRLNSAVVVSGGTLN